MTPLHTPDARAQVPFCLELHSTHHFLVVRHVGVLVRCLLPFLCAVFLVRCWSLWPLDCAALRSRFLPWLSRTVHGTRVECFSTDVAWHCSGEFRFPALVFGHARGDAGHCSGESRLLGLVLSPARCCAWKLSRVLPKTPDGRYSDPALFPHPKGETIENFLDICLLPLAHMATRLRFLQCSCLLSGSAFSWYSAELVVAAFVDLVDFLPVCERQEFMHVRQLGGARLFFSFSFGRNSSWPTKRVLLGLQ